MVLHVTVRAPVLSSWQKVARLSLIVGGVEVGEFSATRRRQPQQVSGGTAAHALPGIAAIWRRLATPVSQCVLKVAFAEPLFMPCHGVWYHRLGSIQSAHIIKQLLKVRLTCRLTHRHL
jgi:hypothetical protein